MLKKSAGVLAALVTAGSSVVGLGFALTPSAAWGAPDQASAEAGGTVETTRSEAQKVDFVDASISDAYLESGVVDDAEASRAQSAAINLSPDATEATPVAMARVDGPVVSFVVTGVAGSDTEPVLEHVFYRAQVNGFWSQWEQAEDAGTAAVSVSLDTFDQDSIFSVEILISPRPEVPVDLSVSFATAVGEIPPVATNALGGEGTTENSEEQSGENAAEAPAQSPDQNATEELDEGQFGEESDDQHEQESDAGSRDTTESLDIEVAQMAAASSQAFDAAAAIANWNPGFILSDATLYTSSRMTQAEIASFIAEKNASCKPGANTTCLRDMRAPKTSIKSKFDGLGYGCKPLNLTASSNTPAKAIKEVADACDINPQVLLVFIQKESSGIFQPLTKARWDKMMGMGCPDNKPCDTQYAGFINQLYYSADALTSYRYRNFVFNNSVKNGVAATVNNSSTYGASCGTQTFRIHNQATASLYTYNPAVPTKAALQSYPGTTGAKCDSYGQRNIYTYMLQWFPDSMLDHPGPDAAGRYSVVRHGASDRYGTNLAVNRATAVSGKPVFVVSGTDFPDALSAGPAAAVTEGSLYLTSSESMREETLDLIKAKSPSAIYVIGGRGAVSENVVDQLHSTTGITPERVGGDNRYQTSALVLEKFFATQAVDTVFVATGRSYADALTASAAGGALGGPVVLIDGESEGVPSSAGTLASNGANKVVAVGGESAVSAQALAAVGAQLPSATIQRLGGSDRYDTNLRVNSYLNAVSTSDVTSIWVATGRGYADALSAAVPAATTEARLVLSDGSCLRSPIVSEWINGASSKVNSVNLVGGESVLSSEVAALTQCG